MDHASFFTEATFVEMLRSRRANAHLLGIKASDKKKKKKKNRGIRTKADGRLFHGKQRSASESRAPSTKIWCWLHVMLILASDNVKNKKDQKKSSKQTSRGDCPKLGRSQARITMKDRNNFGSKSTNYKV